ETDAQWRELAVYIVGGAGAVMAVGGFLLGLIRADLLMPYGVLLALLGLCYVWAFIRNRGVSDQLGYLAGLAVGGVGLLVLLAAVIPTAVSPGSFAPTGVVLVGLGLLYALFPAGLPSDIPFVVMTRRELTSFFFSPVAYFVLIGFTVVAWGCYISFFPRL